MYQNEKPVIISGPCSVETEEQFYSTSLELIASKKIDFIRGGVWKPRTRPGSFEGLGETALKWMSEFRDKYHVPIAVEVATKDQVKLALKYDVDLLWIGARTTGNPFSVQELADELQNTTKPIFVKNPINPDLTLWIGAVERLQKAGIKNIGLIHRGFNIIGKNNYRNPPMWHLAVEMKQKFPDYKLICDPSHIGGKREYILDIAQNAMNLDFDGLMIESHCDPDNAWSDAAQQLKPSALIALLEELDIDTYEKIGGSTNILYDGLKKQVSIIDNELIYLIDRRIELIKQLKSDQGNIDLSQLSKGALMQKVNDKNITEDFLIELFNVLNRIA